MLLKINKIHISQIQDRICHYVSWKSAYVGFNTTNSNCLCTMEAKYIAFSKSMRDLIPISEVLEVFMTYVFEEEPQITYHSHLKVSVNTNKGTTQYTILQSTLFQDNNDYLKFA